MSAAAAPIIGAGAQMVGTGAQLMKSDPPRVGAGQMPQQALSIPQGGGANVGPGQLQANPFPQYSQQQMPDLLALLAQLSGGR